MATSPTEPRRAGPNAAFRELRGALSPGEFAAAVRRAGREIGERVACDARYIGRVESGEIRCPNYAYERVFRHMFPERSLTDLGFEPREAVRGRGAPRVPPAPPSATERRAEETDGTDDSEESDVLRRAFMTSGPAAVAALIPFGTPPARASSPARAGEEDAAAVERAVSHIRLLDDRRGAGELYQPAGEALHAAYALLDAGARTQSVRDRLHSGAGELAISVGWLAHDSGRLADARSYYGEALATARVSGDQALEAHAFCNTAFLARDAERPREAVQAAQAGRRAARGLGSHRLLSLLALREAGGWAGLGDRGGCAQALGEAREHFERGADREAAALAPEWMTFFGEAELTGLEAQCWSALGDWRRAAACARRAVELQQAHFVRNIALFSAELATDLAGLGEPEEAAAAGLRALDLLTEVRSPRVSGMLADTAERLAAYRAEPRVATFLRRQGALGTRA